MNYFRILNCEHAVKDPMVCITNFEDLKIGSIAISEEFWTHTLKNWWKGI